MITLSSIGNTAPGQMIGLDQQVVQNNTRSHDGQIMKKGEVGVIAMISRGRGMLVPSVDSS